MKATIASLIFLLLSLAVSSQTYKYIGIEEGLSNQKIYRIQKDAWIHVVPHPCGNRPI